MVMIDIRCEMVSQKIFLLFTYYYFLKYTLNVESDQYTCFWIDIINKRIADPRAKTWVKRYSHFHITYSTISLYHVTSPIEAFWLSLVLFLNFWAQVFLSKQSLFHLNSRLFYWNHTHEIYSSTTKLIMDSCCISIFELCPN